MACDTDPLHGVLVVGQVVQTQGHSGGGHRRPGDLQQHLNPPVGDELGRKLLMEEQRRQILERKRTEGGDKDARRLHGNESNTSD